MEYVLYTLLLVLICLFVVYVIVPSDKLFKLAQNIERRVAGLALKTVSISEGEITYLTSKNNDLPTLLLLHGFGANKDNWVRMSKTLSNNYRIVALDLPGFGESFKHKKLSYGIQSQINRVNEFVEALNLAHIHIAGNSMGGLIAANFACQFNEKIKSLWLLNPLGVVSAPDSEMAVSIKNNQEPILLAKNSEQFNQLLKFVFYQKPYLPKFVEANLAKEAVENYPLNCKIFNTIRSINDNNALSNLSLETALIDFNKPILITWGNKDRVLNYKGAEILIKIVPHAQLNIMDNIGHLPMLETPKETAKVFLGFVQKNDGKNN